MAGVHGIDVLPGARELAGFELALAGEVGRESLSREALERGAYRRASCTTRRRTLAAELTRLVAAHAAAAPVGARDEVRPRVSRPRAAATI